MLPILQLTEGAKNLKRQSKATCDTKYVLEAYSSNPNNLMMAH